VRSTILQKSNGATRKPFQTDTSTSHVVRVLSEAILTGKLVPGERLKHTKLATDFRMSRIPVREAIQKLEEQGLVVTVARRGTFVVSLNDEEVQKINSLRIVLEAEALILCRARLVPERERALASLVYQWEERIHRMDASQAAQLDLSIHRTIWECAGNEYLLKILTSLTVPLFAHRVISKLNVEKDPWGPNTHMPLLTFVQGMSDLSAEDIIVKHLRNGWNLPERYSHLGVSPAGTVDHRRAGIQAIDAGKST
jgi:DNA-binding GntR family transcriptional regulator